MAGAAAMVGASILVLIVVAIIDVRFWWVGLFVILFALLGSVGRFLRWRTTEFLVTTERLIARSGIIGKSAIEIPLDRIMNISYHQKIWERVLGTGDLVVESAGEHGHQVFNDVAKPSYVQNVIYKQAEIYEARRSHGGSGMGDLKREGSSEDAAANGNAKPSDDHRLSIIEQIEKLASMRDRGILSDGEFEKKKKDLLERL
jgi:uncharacterized membrane protein YdbT with pleckstrin-like domain